MYKLFYSSINCFLIFSFFSLALSEYDEETFQNLKARAIKEAELLMMQEIFNITKDLKLNPQIREELIQNLSSTAPMNTFSINADISDSLVQNAGDFSGSIFASRDGQNTWFSSTDVSLVGSAGYETTWATSVETSGNNLVDWYLSGVVSSDAFGLDYGTLIVSQSPNNFLRTFPAPSNLLATIVEDPSNDSTSGANYDVERVSASFSGDWVDPVNLSSVDKLFFELDLAGSCCDEGGLFGPWYLYGIGIVNPDAELTSSAYAIGYGNGGFGQLSPGLLTIDGDLANGDVSGFEYISTNIDYQESGDKLHLALNTSDLFNHPGFGAWPNSLKGLVLVGVVVQAGLDGLSIDATVLDQTAVGIHLLNSQHQEGNTSPSLVAPSFDQDSGSFIVSYIDNEDNIPWLRKAQVVDQENNIIAYADMVPSSHLYDEGVSFSGNINDLVFTSPDQAELNGDYDLQFLFSDSDTSPEILTLPISVGSGCLIGDSNGDETLNVLDVVLLVNLVLGPAYEDCADTNGDSVLNVLDVVTLVNLVLNP